MTKAQTTIPRRNAFTKATAPAQKLAERLRKPGTPERAIEQAFRLAEDAFAYGGGPDATLTMLGFVLEPMLLGVASTEDVLVMLDTANEELYTSL